MFKTNKQTKQNRNTKQNQIKQKQTIKFEVGGVVESDPGRPLDP